MTAKRALLSVYRKDGIVELAQGLAHARLRDRVHRAARPRSCRRPGVAVTGVSEATGFPEILDGRVKTLHPAIHGGILARRDKPEHAEALAEHADPVRRRRGREPLSVRGQGREGRALRRGGREHRRRRPDACCARRPRTSSTWRSWSTPPTTRCCSSSSTARAASTPPRGSTSRRRPSATRRATRPRSPATSRRSRRATAATASPSRDDVFPYRLASPSRRCRTCATARTRTSARPSTATWARRSTRWRRPASCRARSSRSTTSSTSTRPGGWSPRSTSRPA